MTNEIRAITARIAALAMCIAQIAADGAIDGRGITTLETLCEALDGAINELTFEGLWQ